MVNALHLLFGILIFWRERERERIRRPAADLSWDKGAVNVRGMLRVFWGGGGRLSDKVRSLSTLNHGPRDDLFLFQGLDWRTEKSEGEGEWG